MRIYLRGPLREAGRHLLDNTPLGEAVLRLEAVVDDGHLLEVDVPHDAAHTLSGGERALLRYLGALAGQDACNLWSLTQAIDRDCQLAAVWSFGLATGHFAAMTPVRFVGTAR